MAAHFAEGKPGLTAVRGVTLFNDLTLFRPSLVGPQRNNRCFCAIIQYSLFWKNRTYFIDTQILY